MLTVLLIRHAAHDELGRVLSGRSDLPLNAAGREQAFCLARHLQREAIDVVAASPCLRARETALPIAEQQGREAVIVDDLNEIDFGGWTGRSFEMLRSDSLWNDWNVRRSESSPPNGETMAAAIGRSVRYIESQRVGDEDRTVACVSHGDIIRGTIAHYLGLGFDNIHRFDIAPASVSKIEMTGYESRVVLLNQIVDRGMAAVNPAQIKESRG